MRTTSLGRQARRLPHKGSGMSCSARVSRAEDVPGWEFLIPNS